MLIEDAIAKDKGELYKGMFVTEFGYSDRYAAIVAWVSKSRKRAIIVYVGDDGKVVGDADAKPISMGKDGRWFVVGETGRSRKSLELGRLDNYTDPCF